MFGCMVNAQRNHVREVNRRTDEVREDEGAVEEQRAAEQAEAQRDEAAGEPHSAG